MKNKVSTGTILISKPFIEDKRFEKTIILIVETNSDGSIGFILNKKTNKTMNDIVTKQSENFNINIQHGGPVETNNLFFMHKHPQYIPDGKEIKNGIFWGGDMNVLLDTIHDGKIDTNQILFFIGYAGWENGQLQSEIKEGSWLLHDINITELNTNLSWQELLIQINRDYEVWATAPSDFHLN